MRSRALLLAAALLVLALGIALGTGPLRSGDADRLGAADRRAERADRRADALAAVGSSASTYAVATGPSVVRGTLTGRSIALLALPGADPDDVAAVRTLIGAAGGAVTASVSIGPDLLAPGNRGLVDALTSQMLTQTRGVAVATGATGYQRAGALLARATGVGPAARLTSAPYDTGAISVVSGLTTAKLVSSARITARAALALIVTGPRTAADSAGTSAAVIAAYASQVPTVVAGPAAAARPAGLLAALRAGPAATVLSTVDSLDQPYGQVVTVLAVAARSRGAKGAWGGVGDVDGAVPPPA